MSYTPSKSLVLKLWKKLGHNNLGKWLVGKIICFKAPYFSTIKPRFEVIEPGKVVLSFKKRRAVLNHIRTVHAIAMCNAAELAAGVCLDVSLSANMRWIPIEMTVKYLKKATTDLRAVCEIKQFDWETPQDVVIPVILNDINENIVFSADITMKISNRK